MRRIRWDRVAGMLLVLAGIAVFLWSLQFWLPSAVEWVHGNLVVCLVLAAFIGYVFGSIEGEERHRELDRYAKQCYAPSHRTPTASTGHGDAEKPTSDTVEKVEVVS